MKVYLFQNGEWSTGDQPWLAVTEEGEVLAQHVSSCRAWGIHDVGPEGFYADRYPADAEVIACEPGEFPPPEVLEANQRRAAEPDVEGADHG